MSRQYVDSVQLATAARLLGVHQKMLARNIESGALALSPSGDGTISGAALYEMIKERRNTSGPALEDEISQFKSRKKQAAFNETWKAHTGMTWEETCAELKRHMARCEQKRRLSLLKLGVS